MGIADRLSLWKTIRRRRHSIGQFLSENRIVEVEWRPPEASPLHHEGSTLRLPMDTAEPCTGLKHLQALA